MSHWSHQSPQSHFGVFTIEDDRSARRFEAASDGPETDRDGGGYRSVNAGRHRKQGLGRVGELAGRSRRQDVVLSPGTWVPSEQN